jgi:MFS family permease
MPYSPMGMWIDRHYSRQFPYLIGLLIQLLSTIIIWLGRNIVLQLTCRILQGAAAAIVYITGLAIMVDTVGVQHIGASMGYIAIALNSGTFAGPMLGGIVFAEMGYDAVFAMTLGLIALDIALRLMMIEKSTSSKWLPKGEQESLLGGYRPVKINQSAREQRSITLEDLE